MKTTQIAGGLAGLALAAGLTACGSSSSSSTATAGGGGFSRPELAAKANAICAAAQSKASAIKAPTNIGSDATAAAGYFDKVFPITDQETRDLQALTPRADAATGWQTFVTAQVAADQLLRTLKQKADAKDPSGVNDLKGVAPASQLVAAAAKKIGATTCAGG